MQIVYIGMFDEVEVRDWGEDDAGDLKRARRGEVVDIPDAVAVRLLEQGDNWALPETRAGSGRQSEPVAPGDPAPEG